MLMTFPETCDQVPRQICGEDYTLLPAKEVGSVGD
jgi:hypothetical protein